MPKALQQGELKFWGELCSYIDHVKVKLGVPGVAVAVVGGATGARGPFLGEKCAGLRSLAAAGLPVDRDTVFQLASVSKPITTTVLAGLTAPAGGKLKWLDKVPRGLRDPPPTVPHTLLAPEPRPQRGTRRDTKAAPRAGARPACVHQLRVHRCGGRVRGCRRHHLGGPG